MVQTLLVSRNHSLTLTLLTVSLPGEGHFEQRLTKWLPKPKQVTPSLLSLGCPFCCYFFFFSLSLSLFDDDFCFLALPPPTCRFWATAVHGQSFNMVINMDLAWAPRVRTWTWAGPMLASGAPAQQPALVPSCSKLERTSETLRAPLSKVPWCPAGSSSWRKGSFGNLFWWWSGLRGSLYLFKAIWI